MLRALMGNQHQLLTPEQRQERDRVLADLSARFAREERDDVVNVLQTFTGRRFVRRLLNDLGIRSKQSSNDQADLARRASKRDFAISLEMLIEQVCPDASVLMLKERIEEEARIADERRNVGL